MQERNKEIAYRYYSEIMNQGNLAVIDELMSPDFLFTIPTAAGWPPRPSMAGSISGTCA